MGKRTRIRNGFASPYAYEQFQRFYAYGIENEVFSTRASVGWQIGSGSWQGEFAWFSALRADLGASVAVTIPALDPALPPWDPQYFFTPSVPFTAEMSFRHFNCDYEHYQGGPPGCDPLDIISLNIYGTLQGRFLAVGLPMGDDSYPLWVQGEGSSFTVEGGTWQRLSLDDPAPTPTPEPGTAAVGGAAALLLWMRSRVRS